MKTLWMSSGYKLQGIFFLWLAFSSQVWSLPCVITVVKSRCWSDYDVSVDILDSTYSTSLSKVNIAKGVGWQRTTFDCKPSQVLSANATFTPAIWKNQQGVVYQSVRFWKLPEQAPVAGSIWTINMCYPMHFKNVPAPVDTTNCECSMDGIPPVVNTNVSH